MLDVDEDPVDCVTDSVIDACVLIIDDCELRLLVWMVEILSAKDDAKDCRDESVVDVNVSVVEGGEEELISELVRVCFELKSI